MARTFGSKRTNRADVTGCDQPDARERDAALLAEFANDAPEQGVEAALVRNAEKQSLEGGVGRRGSFR